MSNLAVDSVLNSSAQYVEDASGNASSLALTKQAYVGVGTTNPQAPIHVNRDVGSATGKQLVADFSVTGTSANTHLYLHGDGNTNSANYISTSGTEKLILGDGSNPDTMAVTGARVGVGTLTPASTLEVDGGDIEVDDSDRGIILRSPSGTRWRIKVANDGSLTTTAI